MRNVISINDAYTALSARRKADLQAVTGAAIDAFTSIAVGMNAGERNGPSELSATFALLQMEALEGMAELGAQLAPEFHNTDAVTEVPDIEEISRFGGLLCEVLVRSAPGCSTPSEQLGLLRAAVHAGRIRDLLV